MPLEIELATGEVARFSDDFTLEEAQEIIQRDYFSPQARPGTLVHSLIQAESGGDPNAVSEDGAIGLMQVMPQTGLKPGYGAQGVERVEDLYNPSENVRVGSEYLSGLLEKYNGNVRHALAAWNWGPGNADKWIAQGEPPDELPDETFNLINRTLANYQPGDQPAKDPLQIREPEIQEGGLLDNMMARYEAGTEAFISTLAEGGRTLTELVGSEETAAQLSQLAQDYRRYSAETFEEAGIDPTKDVRLKDVENIGGFMRYLAEQAPQLLPQVQGAIGAAAIGALAALPVTTSAAGIGAATLASQALYGLLATTGESRSVIEQALTDANLAPDTELSVADLLRNSPLPIDVPPELDLGTITQAQLSSILGVANAGIELGLGVEPMTRRLIGGTLSKFVAKNAADTVQKSIKRGVIGSVVSPIVKGTAIEAGEEVVQGLINRGGEVAITGEEFMTPEQLNEHYEEAVLGAVGGFMGGSQIGIVQGLVSRGKGKRPGYKNQQGVFFDTGWEGTEVEVEAEDGSRKTAGTITGAVNIQGENFYVLNGNMVIPPRLIKSTREKGEDEFSPGPLPAIFRDMSDYAPGEEVAASRIMREVPHSPREPVQWFDTIQNIVQNAKLQKARGDQWLSTIRNTPGLKKAFADWYGLEDFIRPNSTYTKEEILDLLSANQPFALTEVTLADTESPELQATRAQLEEVENQWNTLYSQHVVNLPEEVQEVVPRLGLEGLLENGYITEEQYNNIVDLFQEGRELENRIAELADQGGRAPNQKYSFQGGTNYREIFVQANPALREREILGTDPRTRARWGDGHPEYRGITNPITRLRLIDREHNGKKYLFIEEMQPPDENNFDRMPKALQNTWMDFAARRAIMEAVDGNYDAIAWTSGHQQRVRWRHDYFDIVNPAIQMTLNTDGSLQDATMFVDPRSGDIAKRVPEDLKRELEEAREAGQKLSPNDVFQFLVGRVGRKAAEEITKGGQVEEQGHRDGSTTITVRQNKTIQPRGAGLARLYDQKAPSAFQKIGKRFGDVNIRREDLGLTNAQGRTDTGESFVMDLSPSFKDSVSTLGMPAYTMRSRAALQAPDIAKTVERIIKEIAPTANMKISDIVTTPDTGEMVGGYQLGNLIAVALEGNDAPRAAFHEAFHFLERNGFFTPAEQQVLQRAHPQLRRLMESDLQNFANATPEIIAREAAKPHEVRAYAAGKYLMDREESGIPQAVQSIFDKMGRLLERLRNALRGLGFQSFEDVFDRARSGEVGRRAAAPTNTRGWFEQRDARSADTRLNNAGFAAYTKTTPDAFGEWFGNSQAVDSTGQPKPMFYTTANGLGLNPELGGEMTDFIAGPGFYIIDDPLIASNLAGHPTEVEPAIFPVIIRAENPLYAGDPITADQHARLLSYLNSNTLHNNDAIRGRVKDILDAAETPQDILDARSPYASGLVNKLARETGHDGIKFDVGQTAGANPAEAWVVFDDAQIKTNYFEPAPSFRMWRDKKDRPPRVVPDSTPDVGMFSRWLKSPRLMADTYAPFTPVFQTAKNLRFDKNRIQSEAGQKMAPYGRLDDNSTAGVNAVLELERLQGFKAFPNNKGDIIVVNSYGNTDLSRKGDVIRLTGQQVEAHQAVQHTGEFLWDELRAAYIETLEPFTIEDTEIDFKVTTDMTAADISEMIEGIRHVVRPTLETENQIEQYNRLQERLGEVAQQLGQMEQARESYTYTPFNRYGDWGLVLEDGDGNTLHFEAFESTLGPRLQKRVPQKKVDDRAAELIQRYTDEGHEGVRIRTDESGVGLFRMSNDKIARMAGTPLLSIDMLISQLAENKRGAWEELRPQIEEIMKTRGFQRHMQQPELLPGYSTDFKRGWGNYIVGISGFLSRQKWIRPLEKAVAAIPNNQPALKQEAQRYADYMLDPTEEFAAIRALGFTFFLGGNPSSAIIQLFNIPIFTAPYLSQFTSFARSNKETYNASQQVVRILAKSAFKTVEGKPMSTGDPTVLLDLTDPKITKMLSEDERMALARGMDEGFIKPQLMIQQAGLTPIQKANVPIKMAKGWQDAQMMLAGLFGTMETMGRTAQFLAAYRLARKDPKVLERANKVFANNPLWAAETKNAGPDELPFIFARFGIDKIMGEFDKTNRPRYQRYTGSLLFQFQTWIHQILETLALEATKQGPAGKKAFALSMATLLFTSGINGLPGAEDLKDIIEAAYKSATHQDLDLDAELREMTQIAFDNKYIADSVVRGGLRHLTGYDVSRRVGLGDLPGSNLVRAVLGGEEVSQAAGPIGAIGIGNVKAFLERRDAGESGWTAARELYPQFLKNAVEGAYIWNTDGYHTRRGTRIVGPNDITTRDITTKILGFQPTRLSVIRENLFAQQRVRTAGQQGPQRIFRRRIIDAILHRNDAYFRGDQSAMADATRDLNQIIKELQEFNTGRQPHERVTIDTDSLLNAVMMQLNPEVRMIKRAPAKARQRILEIQRLNPYREQR